MRAGGESDSRFAIFARATSAIATDFPPLKTLDARPYNLPVQRELFIGREQEIGAVVELLHHSSGELATLTVRS